MSLPICATPYGGKFRCGYLQLDASRLCEDYVYDSNKWIPSIGCRYMCLSLLCFPEVQSLYTRYSPTLPREAYGYTPEFRTTVVHARPGKCGARYKYRAEVWGDISLSPHVSTVETEDMIVAFLLIPDYGPPSPPFPVRSIFPSLLPSELHFFQPIEYQPPDPRT